MESLAGAAMLLLGVLVILFGGARPTKDDGAIARALALPAWLDALLKWIIGGACVAFGAALLTGHAHYF
jgi:hypothetical protein